MLARQLADLLGTANVAAEPEVRAAFSADIFKEGVLAELVIAPGTVDELSAAVALCTGHGRCVIARGGGFSYTGGYVPVRERTVMVDMRRLDRIVEINAVDMYVTVECGCTWKTLYEALRDAGLRVPCFGPLSGFAATVGGALSQGSFFLGSTAHGTTAESTLGLEVILADGTRLVTGSAAARHAPSPFFRTYGPDLTGVFLGDSGALGFKARATLRLIPFPEHQRHCTFSFAASPAVLAALSDIGRQGLAADCCAWDPSVVRKSGAAQYLLHLTVDARSAQAADEAVRSIEALARSHGGTATTSSVPRALRGALFRYPNKILGSAGERWVPLNALCPHSRADAVLAAFHAYMAEHAELTARHGIEWGVLFFAVGNNTICLEPLFYWPDERLPSHDRLMQDDFGRSLPRQPANPAATAAVLTLRAGLIDLFETMGCAHVQIGKTYPYKASRDIATYRLLTHIKAALDPLGLVNPGALSL